MLKVQKPANLERSRRPFPQLEALEAIKDLTYAAVFHEQGLGKTKIGLDLALSARREVVDSVLIVTKKKLTRTGVRKSKATAISGRASSWQDRSAISTPSTARCGLPVHLKSALRAKAAQLFLKTDVSQ